MPYRAPPVVLRCVTAAWCTRMILTARLSPARMPLFSKRSDPPGGIPPPSNTTKSPSAVPVTHRPCPATSKCDDTKKQDTVKHPMGCLKSFWDTGGE